MTPHVQTGSDPGLATLAAGILHDVQELFKQELRLFKHEVEVKLHKIREASTCLTLGLLLLFLGGILLCLTVVYLLNWWFPTLPLWGDYLLVAALVCVPGAILTFTGMHQLQSVSPLPEQTAEALKENLEWTTNQR
jgi:NhaP-type Na+/H+ or K+/H+ antiporter